MSISAPVAFGIVSPGRWGKILLDAAKDVPGLRLAGVCGRDAANAAAVAEKFGGRVLPSYDDLLADPAIEAVVVPTPHFLHHAQTLAALRAGKHVFVEKPIAPTLAEGEGMAREAAARGRVLAVGHQMRFMGFARRLRAMLDAGELGTLAHIAIVHGYPLMLEAKAGDWRTAPEHVPGGPLDEFGVHYFDLLAFLCGPARRVTGSVNRHVTPGTVPDAAVAVIEFANGVIATYASHFVSTGINRLQLFGTRGMLEVNRLGQAPSWWQPTGDMAAARTGGPPPQPITFPEPAAMGGALRAELADFAAAIREGRPPEVGARESLAALRIARAVVEAHETGRSVFLSSPA
ncbi:MAG: Gfo/Idh/MocA family oxidoreductase [Opitutaceae bacterium]|nr:Gfo/Idh/MocA family oxidoreductase [Opitutaceae bacterium]